MLAAGTIYEDANGRLVRIVDRTGHEWARLAWTGDRLDRLVVPGAEMLGAIHPDPLLGDAHAIDGLTTMSAIDWARPTQIPAIAAPGRLPPGSGGAILNVIAILAMRSGVTALRYAGPYPTRALWQSLARSFRTEGTEAAFTADATGRMARLARDPIAIDFVPAPHDRIANPHGHVELRDGVERAVVDRLAFERTPVPGSAARLSGDHAEIWFGDASYARVATFGEDGSLIDGPHAIPACTSDVIGKPFPPALVAALAMLVAEAVPAPLADDARAWIAARPVEWADLGGRAAEVTADGIRVHAAMWQTIGPLGLGRLALALAEALAPVVTQAILSQLIAT